MESQNKKTKKRFKFIAITTSIALLVNGTLLGIGLLWQKSTDSVAVANAFFLSAFIQLSAGWIALMVNMNILSGMVYGLKSFFLIIVGKRPKQGYYEYSEHRKDNPIPKRYILIPIISSIPNFIVSIILYVILF